LHDAAFVHLRGHPGATVQRLVAAVVVIFVEVLVCVLFAWMPMVPHFVAFNPGAALIPASGYFLGPLGAVASLTASIISDHLTGLWSIFSLFKGLGVFLAALSAWALRSEGPFSMIGFCTAGLFSLFAGASWAGVGAELLRIYPFTYIATLALLHDVVFFLLLVPGLWSLGRSLPPVRGGSLSARTYIVGGALAAYGVGVVTSAIFYRAWPFERYHLSDQTGLALVLCVTPLLALHLLGLGRAWFGTGKI
jgi:hypothetical protein